MKLTLILLSILTLNTNLAFADGRGADARAFNSEMKLFGEFCPKLVCEAPYGVELIFTRNEGGNLNVELYQYLSKVADQQAQIWGDTILEGDYYAAGETQLDEVLAIYKNGDLIGYRITYSEKAWDTADCSFDSHNVDSLVQCKEGRIFEASFVSSPLTTYLRDSNQFAEFSMNE